MLRVIKVVLLGIGPCGAHVIGQIGCIGRELTGVMVTRNDFKREVGWITLEKALA